MRLNQWMSCFALSMLCGQQVAYAMSTIPHEQVQVPHCLMTNMTIPHTLLAQDQQFAIIDIDANQMLALTHLADKAHCGRFINISHQLNAKHITQEKQAQQLLATTNHQASKQSLNKSNNYEIKHQEEVNLALKDIVANNIWNTLTHLTTYPNRSATQKTGLAAAKWLKEQFEAMALEHNRHDTHAFFVKTGWYKQPSLVTVIGKDIKAPAVVIGAHMDTLDGLMPGAGDDGSGSATIMETARVLLAAKNNLKRPVYIIWYAAEERGLVGSQYVVQHFLRKNIPVKAAIQFDMTGYRLDAQDPTMWVFTDYTDRKLSDYVATLINTYIHVPVDYSICGYGCSDHASWFAEGVPAAFPCETNYEQHNPYIHSSADTMDLLNLEHMTNFTKLAVAFAIELGSE